MPRDDLMISREVVLPHYYKIESAARKRGSSGHVLNKLPSVTVLLLNSHKVVTNVLINFRFISTSILFSRYQPR